MKRLFTLLMAMVFVMAIGVPSWGQTRTVESVDFSSGGFTNAQDVNDSIIEIGQHTNVVFSKGTGSNTPKYYNTGTAIRAYAGNTIQVTSNSGIINSIAFTYGSGDGTNTITADVGSFSTDTWSAPESAGTTTVTFTVGGSSGHRRIKAIEVNYGASSSVATPTFSPSAGTFFDTPVDVSINCSTPNVAIFYTMDGSTPDRNSLVYSVPYSSSAPEPISITETTTVKAIAMSFDASGMYADSSAVVSATYTIVDYSLKEILYVRESMQNGEYALVQGVVTFIDGKNVYIQDETGGIVLYLNSTVSSLQVGDKVRGFGVRAEFNGLLELTGIDPNDQSQFNIVSNNNTLPLEYATIEDILNDHEAGTNYLQSTRVEILNAIVGTINTSGNTPITQGNQSMNIYKLPVVSGLEAGNVITVTGVVGCYNDPQLRVNSASDVVINEDAMQKSFSKVMSLADINTTDSYLLVCESSSTAATGFNSRMSCFETIGVSITNNTISTYTNIEGMPCTITFESPRGNAPEDRDVSYYVKVGDDYLTNSQILELTQSPNTYWNVSSYEGGYYLKDDYLFIAAYTSAGATQNAIFNGCYIQYFGQEDYPVVVLYKEGSPAQQVESPTFTPVAGTYFNTQLVSIACATDDATIYYTTDGSDPTLNSMVYSQPIEVSSDMVIKAFATRQNWADSEVVSASYQIVNAITIAEARAIALNSYAMVSGVVTYIDGRNVYIQDATAGINLFFTTAPTGLAVGDMVLAYGRRANYNGLVELSGINPNNPEHFSILSSGNTLPLEVKTVAQVLSGASSTLQSTRVKIEDAVIGTINTGGNTTLTQNGQTVNIYKIPALQGIEADSHVNVTAVIGYYNAAQLLVAFAEDVESLSTDLTVATPTFTPDGGSYTEAQMVSILCETEGATIYYTTDGSEPTESSMVYTEPIEVSSSMVINAMATKENWINSAIATATYEIYESVSPALYSKVLNPDDITTTDSYLLVCESASTAASGTVQNNALQTVALSIADNSVTTVADAEGMPYTVTLEAAEGGYYLMINGSYVNNNSGTGISLSQSPASVWAVNYYNGGYILQNTGNGNRFIGGATPEGLVYKVYAVSNLGSEQYPIVVLYKEGESMPMAQVEAPVITPQEGIYDEPQTVSISCATEDATIHYTLDGTDPTTASLVYSAPFLVNSTTTVKALAIKEGMINSAITSVSYTIRELITIVEAKALEVNEYAMVEGVVTFIDGKNVYIQDTTAGIDLFLNSVAGEVAVGDLVRAYGKRSAYNGLIELSGIDPTDAYQFNVVSSGNDLPLAVKTIAECLAGGDDELQSTRVMIEDAVIGAINTNGNTVLTQNGSSINIYKVPALEDVEANSHVNVIAVIGYYNVPQLRVASPYDVVVLNANLAVTPMLLQGFAYEQGEGPSASQAITVSGQYLDENVTLVAAQYFEIGSSVDGPFASTLTLPTDNGTLTATTVYVRLMAELPMNYYEAVLTITSGQDVTSVTLTGNVTISNTVEAPTFTPAAGSYMNAQMVSILCPTDGATIYYTTDGSEPTENSMVYAEPIEVSGSMVVKAMATKPNWMNSEVATASYVILTPMTIAEAKALNANEYAMVEGVVTFIDGKNVYIQDATAGIDLYLNSVAGEVAMGDLVQAYGKRSAYNGLIELSGINPTNANQFNVVSSGNDLPLAVKTIAECLADGADELQSTRVMIEDAVIGAINTNGNTVLTQNGSSINIYKVPALEDVEANSHVNVIAVIGYYNVPQLRVAYPADVEVLEATLTVSPLSLQGFSYEQGEGPSASQAITVSGQYLSDEVTLTSSSYYEMSLTFDGVYSSTLTLPTDYGTLSATTVYVRLMAGLMMADYTSEVTVTAGQEEQVVSLSGNVTISNTVEAPTFTPAAGSYMNAQMVSILCPTEGATIYYTTDGSEPTENSMVYAEPIEVSSSMVINAMATKENWMNSEVATASYVILAPMTIAEAKALNANEYAMVEGVVTFIDGKNVYIQDATAGIDLYLNSVAGEVAMGDLVQAYGKRSAYNGLIELSGINPADANQFNIVSSDNPLPLVVKTIAECLDGGADELQSTRVMIEDAVIGAINTNGNTVLTQNGSSINIYKVPALEDVEANSHVNVIAVIGYYNVPQLRVAYPADVEVLEATLTVSPLSLQGFSYEQGEGPSASQTITVSGQYLAGNVLLTAGQYYKMSLSPNGVYNSTLTLNTEEGTLNTTVIYVQMMAGLMMGNYESSIAVANGSEELLVNLSGSVTISNTVAAPSFTPAGGSYMSAQLVSILCPTEGATIHYTMDGSDPTENSPVYTEPIEVNSTCVIKAMAKKANWLSSTVVTASYEIYSNMTIAEARQLANNQYATVQGVVTLVDGRNVYIQDNTAGIVLYLNNNTVPSDLSIGDKVRCHGRKSVYNGLVELTGIKGNNANELVILSEDNTLPLKNKTIEQIHADYNADNLFQSTRVKLNSAIVRSINYNGNSLIVQGDAQINIYRMPYVEGLEVGDFVDVIGVIGCYNAPQILVAQNTDIAYTHRPGIDVSANSLSTFEYLVDEGPSPVQALMVGGTNLTGYVRVTPSEHFEISAEDGDYFMPTSSVLFFPENGQVAPSPVYVRLKAGLPIGQYNESLVLSSEGADEVYVACNGSVYDQGGPVSNDWKKVADLSEVVDGSRIIIAARYDNENVNSYYAMTASTTGKPTGVLFTSSVSGANEILPASITDEADNFVWTVGRLGDLYTFTNESGAVLGYSSSTNFATGGNNIGWSISEGTSIDTGVMVSNYTAFNIVNANVTTRAAALNSNHNFGPYSTSNMINGNGAGYNFYLDIFISGTSATPTVSAPVFTPEAGTYYEELDVAIESATEDATVYYSYSSSDGPWTVYTAPIHLASSVTIWAYAEKEGYNTSAVVSAAYTINAGMVILIDQDWEGDWDGWTEVNVAGEPQWRINSYSGNHYAYANAYNQGATEDWLISPAFDLDAHPDALLSFRTARNYNGPDIEVYFSNDYDGSDPTAAIWQPIDCELSTGSWSWVETGDLSLSGFTGSNCYIAYRYTSTDDLAAGWEVDDILLYCVGTSANPFLNATPNALSGFTHLEGEGPSASQNFVLTGGNLPPFPGSDEGFVLVYFANSIDFEISLDDQEYSSSLTIPVVGTLEPTTIYVRLNGAEIGHYETDLTIVGSGDVSVTVSLSGDVLSADQPYIDAFMPKYIQGNNGSNNNRVPVAIATYVYNLEPNTTYRYVNQFVDDNDGEETAGAGNVIYADLNGFYRTTSPSLSTEGGYGEFTTDADGEGFAWFINEPTANTRFTPGNHVYLRIRLNDGHEGTSVAYTFTTEDYATVLNFGTETDAYQGTAFYASSEEDPMTFVMMFSNDDDFRPTYSTSIETTGVDYTAINQYADFYKEEVSGKNGYFGGIIPNDDADGINIIWVLDMESYVINDYYTENGDGVWGDVNTANPTGGLEAPVFIDLIHLSVEEGEAMNVKVWNYGHEIMVENAETRDMEMMVYNLLGQPVMRKNIAAQSNTRIPHNLSDGLYVIVLQNTQGKMSAKIVVR